MKKLHALIVCCIMLMFTLPAFAQFPGITPEGQNRGGGQEPGQKSGKLTSRYWNLGIYPLAAFDTAGVFSGRTGTQTLAAPLFTLDAVTVAKKSKIRFEFGGWYWGKSDADLYELHVRAVSASGLGIQIGYLNNTKKTVLRPGFTAGLLTDANANDIFVLYELHSPPKKKGQSASKRKTWGVQFGAGVFIDYTPHLLTLQPGQSNPNQPVSGATTSNYTFFVAGGIELAPRFSILASEWIIRDRGEDLNRVAVGLGYRF